MLALFFATSINWESHTAAIILLDHGVGIDNFAIGSAKTRRIENQ